MNKTSAKTSAKKDEALHKALRVLNCLNNDRVYETAWVKGAINACEEALERPSWQGLSDDEINKIYGEVQDNCIKDFPTELYAAWFEALKEKNTP